MGAVESVSRRAVVRASEAARETLEEMRRRDADRDQMMRDTRRVAQEAFLRCQAMEAALDQWQGQTFWERWRWLMLGR